MIRSLRTAEKAMQMEQVRIDALANNLANVDSTGFRQILTRVKEENEAAGPGGDLQALKMGREAWAAQPRLDMGHALDVRPGAIEETGRPTDVAIMGRGFFVIGTEEGERYTRNGSFILNEQRQLTTPEGKLVQGEGGPLTLDGNAFSIEADGTVMVDGNQAGKLRLVDFAEPTRLEHMGANLLTAPEDMQAQPVPAGEATVAQGHIEGSNVNAIDTLVAMIAAQRAFEVQSKVMSTEDEMLNKSVNNLPRISA
ncbi:MAG: flagellar hook-basal body protein [bacterium]